MTSADKLHIEHQLLVLREVVANYRGHTLENVIQQLQAIVDEYHKQKKQL